jgi:GTP-binding protein YchF
VALEAGIVGLPSSGKTTLFRALTRAEAHGSGAEHVGMAQIPDERLDRLAATVGARKVTPAAVRVVDVPGRAGSAAGKAAGARLEGRDAFGAGGPQLLGNLRQVDALVVVLDGFSGTRVPGDDLETLKLELLVADRDHVERRLDRVSKQAKSGEAKLRAEQAELERLLAHLDAGRTLAEWEGELPPELEPLTTKPLIAIVNGPGAASAGGEAADALPETGTPSASLGWIDLELEAELAELTPEEAAEFRGEGESALGEVVRRLAETLDVITFFTAGEKETRAWTLRRGQTALDAAATIHSDIARGFIRCEVVRWDDLVEAGGHAEAARAGKQRLEGKTYVVADGDVLNVRFNE